MGIALFMIFRQIKMKSSRAVNALAKSTVFVFLLHETVLGVFWHFDKINGLLRFFPHLQFIVWTAVYLLACFLVGLIVQKMYVICLEPCYDKVIRRICAWKIVGELEKKYRKLEAKH